jgi:cytochrome c5
MPFRICPNRFLVPWRLGVLVFPFLTACTQQMADQPRYDVLESSRFFSNGSSARPLPDGVVASSYVSEEQPQTRDRAFLLRGQERYNIYCSPCHDYVGTGRGMAAVRGFQRMPPSLHGEELRSAPDKYLFDVMTNGFGAMPPYANQIPVRDRWASTAYIRALQLSQSATISDVAPNERPRLESENGK